MSRYMFVSRFAVVGTALMFDRTLLLDGHKRFGHTGHKTSRLCPNLIKSYVFQDVRNNHPFWNDPHLTFLAPANRLRSPPGMRRNGSELQRLASRKFAPQNLREEQ